jgi:hypothetical protein
VEGSAGSIPLLFNEMDCLLGRKRERNKDKKGGKYFIGSCPISYKVVHLNCVVGHQSCSYWHQTCFVIDLSCSFKHQNCSGGYQNCFAKSCTYMHQSCVVKHETCHATHCRSPFLWAPMLRHQASKLCC